MTLLALPFILIHWFGQLLMAVTAPIVKFIVGPDRSAD